jgi:hypothetical protein
MMKIVCVPPEHARAAWPHVCELISNAMRRGGLGAYGTVAESVLEGRALLWLAWDGNMVHAAAVTTLAATEWRKVCEIVACGGHGMRHWLHLIWHIEQFARKEGCSATRILGRKGWARMLREYRTKRVVLEKELA